MSHYSSPHICQSCLGYMNLGSLSNRACGDECLSCRLYTVLSPHVKPEPEMDEITLQDHDRHIAALAREALSQCISTLIPLAAYNTALDDLIQSHINHLREMRSKL